uniref:Uncharacterized protein n=1 Tax=Siphoviridae sp. ctNNQ1 TaxID=2827571 RepID=A0A8S5LNR4_9CAUD|nr:MAG TPA: hypothetical protein [Siphoviridae sp. ctNNQ1]
MPLSCPFHSHKITIPLGNTGFSRGIFLSLESVYFYKYLYIVLLYLTTPFRTAIF